MNKLEYIRFLNGDIVYIHGSVRVISSCDGYYSTYYDEDETLQEVNVNVIEGIPLTTVILEKNGWEFMGHQVDFGGFLFDIYGKRDILPYLYYYYATKDFSVYICGEVALPDMKYVHELQHLLFGLGLNSEMEV